MNYILTSLSAGGATVAPFTVDEVKAAKAAYPKFNGRKVHGLRKIALEKQPK